MAKEFQRFLVKAISCTIIRRCRSGFTGPDCQKCPYPLFGDDCKDKCKCSFLLCHHKAGCPPGNSFVFFFKRRIQKSNFLKMI